MLFQDSNFNEYHMMDMDFGNWFYMILGIGVFLLFIIALTYIFTHVNNKSNSQSQIKAEKHEINAVKSNETNIAQIALKEANFCYNCGQKLEDKYGKFCPYCGEQV
ncbi:MAG: hypothetical protein ACFE9N_14905 [Promethearchaeota archaeon]